MRKAIVTSEISSGRDENRTQKDEVLFLKFGLTSSRFGTETGAVVEFKNGTLAVVPLSCIRFVNEQEKKTPNID